MTTTMDVLQLAELLLGKVRETPEPNVSNLRTLRDTLSTALAIVRSTLQSRSPTHLVPPEILTRIFGYVPSKFFHEKDTDTFGLFTIMRTTDLFPLTHVCRYWRAVALQAPLLWTNIFIDDSRSNDKARECLDRSQMTNLNVHADFNVYADDLERYLMQQLLASNAPRIQELILRGYSSSLQQLFSHPDFSTPRLQRLAVHVMSSKSGSLMTFPDTILQIKILSLRGVLWRSSRIFPHLTLLILHNSQQSTLQELLAFLSWCPQLQELLFNGSVPDGTDSDSEPVSMVSLLHLRKLTVSMVLPPSIHQLLSHLEMPSLLALSVMMEGPFRRLELMSDQRLLVSLSRLGLMTGMTKLKLMNNRTNWDSLVLASPTCGARLQGWFCSRNDIVIRLHDISAILPMHTIQELWVMRGLCDGRRKPEGASLSFLHLESLGALPALRMLVLCKQDPQSLDVWLDALGGGCASLPVAPALATLHIDVGQGMIPSLLLDTVQARRRNGHPIQHLIISYRDNSMEVDHDSEEQDEEDFGGLESPPAQAKLCEGFDRQDLEAAVGSLEFRPTCEVPSMELPEICTGAVVPARKHWPQW